jgi:hypothetical protein
LARKMHTEKSAPIRSTDCILSRLPTRLDLSETGY